MRKSLTTLALVSTAALALAACGGGTSEGDATASSSGGASSAAGGATGDDCTLKDPVKVGAALSLTGAAGSYGTSQKKGLELAAEDLKAKKGVTYDLKIEDDATDPKQGITVFEGFVERHQRHHRPDVVQHGSRRSRSRKRQDACAGHLQHGHWHHRPGDLSSVTPTEARLVPQTAKAKEKYSFKKVVVMYSVTTPSPSRASRSSRAL